MAIELYDGDIPKGLDFGAAVAVDSETMGLNPLRDRLCLIQLSAGDGDAHLVRFRAGEFDAPRLRALFEDESVMKIFHFARFDMAVISHYLGVMPKSVFCTKIASKLVRTFTNKHGLKDLCRELINVDISKQQQSSDWGAAEYSDAQLEYAASDVFYLHQLKAQLEEMLKREGRTELAEAVFGFLQHRVKLDLGGWPETDIFAHS